MSIFFGFVLWGGKLAMYSLRIKKWHQNESLKNGRLSSIKNILRTNHYSILLYWDFITGDKNDIKMKSHKLPLLLWCRKISPWREHRDINPTKWDKHGIVCISHISVSVLQTMSRLQLNQIRRIQNIPIENKHDIKIRWRYMGCYSHLKLANCITPSYYQVK